MTIEQGRGGKPIEIRISAQSCGPVELWIGDRLSYLTATDLAELHKMVVLAARDLFS